VAEALGGLGLAGGETLVLYGGTWEELARAFWLLEWAGAAEVQVLDGGVEAWRAAGGRLERGPPPAAAARAFDAEPRRRAAADPGWLYERFGQPGLEVLDLRDRGVWTANGYAAPPRWSAGHVPHALPFDFRSWLPDDGGRWPEPGPVRDRLAGLGPREWEHLDLDAEIVLYGEGPDDPAAALGYLWLRRLGLAPRVLAGGFSGWAGEPGDPVVEVVDTADLELMLELGNPGLAADAPPPGLALVDLREDWDWAAGHLPGAVNLPTYRFVAELERTLDERWPGLGLDAPLVFYCYGRGCIRSREAATHAARLGHTRLLWFREGVDAWSAAGLPLPASPLPAVD
jgi:thiosulfate/3-mercaptopyruvate sulfurtransferase